MQMQLDWQLEWGAEQSSKCGKAGEGSYGVVSNSRSFPGAVGDPDSSTERSLQNNQWMLKGRRWDDWVLY